MSEETGRNWQQKEAGTPLISTKTRGVVDANGEPQYGSDGSQLIEFFSDISVISEHSAPLNGKLEQNWFNTYEASARSDALRFFYLSKGIIPPSPDDPAILAQIELIDHYVPTRPGSSVRFLYRMSIENWNNLSGPLQTDNLGNQSSLQETNDMVMFPNFVAFAKRMEILAQKLEEYDEKVRKSATTYYGPAGQYDNFLFKDEAEHLRTFYERLWDYFKANKVPQNFPFYLMFNVEPLGNPTIPTEEDELKWFDPVNPAKILGVYVKSSFEQLSPTGEEITENNFVAIYGDQTTFNSLDRNQNGSLSKSEINSPAALDVFSVIPQGYETEFSKTPYNDPRRIWLVRRLKELTGDLSPFIDDSAEVSVEFTGISASDIKFQCSNPNIIKSALPDVSYDDFVKTYVRPLPRSIPQDSTVSKNNTDLSIWESTKKSFTPVVNELERLQENASWDNALREAVQNRRKNISNYVGDYFMSQMPGKPKKVRSLDDAYRYVLSRMDIPILVTEALDCMYLDFSIEDVLDALCDEILEKLFGETGVEKLERFAVFLDSGGYIPGTQGVGEFLNINVTDVAYIVRGAIQEEIAKGATSNSTLSDQTKQALYAALNEKYGKSWKRFFCEALAVAPFMLVGGVAALIKFFKDRTTSDEEVREKEPIPPFKKCDSTYSTLADVPIVGTLYDMAIREAEKRIEEEIMKFAEEMLVIPLREFMWSWQKWCIDNKENKSQNYGSVTANDFEISSADEQEMRQRYFPGDFDWRKFINQLLSSLTDREICGLMNGEQPSDEVSRFVVQFVQNYVDASGVSTPQNLKNSVSDETKVVPFFSSLKQYFDISICDDLLDLPRDLLDDPCNDIGTNQSEQAYMLALQNRGLSTEEVEQQMSFRKQEMKNEFISGIKKMSENTDQITFKLAQQIKETAQQNFVNILTAPGASAFDFSLKTIVDSIIQSFQTDSESFYQILATSENLIEQIFEKVFDLSEQRIYGEDIPADGNVPLVSKYHNYDLQVDKTIVTAATIESDICRERGRQIDLMVRIMDNARWKRYDHHSSKVFFSGEARRGLDSAAYTMYPPMHIADQDIDTNQLSSNDFPWYSIPAGVVPIDYEYGNTAGSIPDQPCFLYGGYNDASDLPDYINNRIQPNFFDPANMLNHTVEHDNILANFSKEELDDLLRIAFRYYARYTYNYDFNGFKVSECTPLGLGNPKPETLVLRPKGAKPGEEGFDKTIFYGYSSFLIDPVEMTNEEMAKYLDGVDFRCGHRGPGAHPGQSKDQNNKFSNSLTWADFLARMSVSTGIDLAAGDTTLAQAEYTYFSSQGLPAVYIYALQDRLSYPGALPADYITDLYDRYGWGFYDPEATGWNVQSTKECLLRLFLFRFAENNLIGSDNTKSTLQYGRFKDIGTRVVRLPKEKPGDPDEPESLIIYLTEDMADSDEVAEYSNIVGGHMERALHYYRYGLDFHPGHSFYPFLDENDDINFVFTEYHDEVKDPDYPGLGDKFYEGPLSVVTYDEFKYSELAEWWVQAAAAGEDAPPEEYKGNIEFQLAIAGFYSFAYSFPGFNLGDMLLADIIEQQPFAQSKALKPGKFYEDGPLKGQKIPLWALGTWNGIYHRNFTPSSMNILECADVFYLDPSIIIDLPPTPNNIGNINFALLAQMEPETTTDESKNSYCIIDRYSIKTEDLNYAEEKKLIQITPLLDSQGDLVYINNTAGRYKQAVDILGDETILSEPIEPGPSLGDNIDTEVCLQPQVFEKYVTKKIVDGDLALTPYLSEQQGPDTWLGSSTIAKEALLESLQNDKTSTFELYGEVFKSMITKISKILFEGKEEYATKVSELLSSSKQIVLELGETSDPDSILGNAKKHYKELVEKVNPILGEQMPSVQDVFITVSEDEDGNVSGGTIARILVKIFLIEFLVKSIGVTLFFKPTECLKGDIVSKYISSIAKDNVKEFYDLYNNIPNMTDELLQKVIDDVIENELEDVLNLFSNLFDKQPEDYESAVDQIILSRVFDLAEMFSEQEVMTPAKYLKPKDANLKDVPRLSLNADVVPANIVGLDSDFQKVNLTWSTTRLQSNQYEKDVGPMLEKYVKIKFFPKTKIVKNLMEANIEPDAAESFADSIYNLPVEYRGQMYQLEENEGEPVYINPQQFREVYQSLAIGIGSMLPAGSIFEWKQVIFEDIFDQVVDNAKEKWNEKDENENPLYYVDELTPTIQEELALVEKICTLKYDYHKVWYKNSQGDSIHQDIKNNYGLSINGDAMPTNPGPYTNPLNPANPYQIDYVGNKLNAESIHVPLVMQYSDLSIRKITNLPPDVDTPYFPQNYNSDTWHLLGGFMNTISENDPHYVDHDQIAETRPLSVEYLDHLNGSKVFGHTHIKAEIQKLKEAYNEGEISEAQFGAAVLNLPRQTNGIFSFIPENHRKILTNVAFRYYTYKYFGDFTGFKIKDPWSYSATPEGRAQINDIFAGRQMSGEISAENIFKGTVESIKVGEFFGEGKSIGDSVFLTDKLKKDKSKQVVPGTGEGGLFLGKDELSHNLNNLQPFESLDEFYNQEDFERHMLYGLFFGFDSIKYHRLVFWQYYAPPEDLNLPTIGAIFHPYPWKYATKTSVKRPLDFFRNYTESSGYPNSGNVIPWTPAYQRDLFRAMAFYKNGDFTIPSFNKGPIDLFTDGKLITDFEDFQEESFSGNIESLNVSKIASEASFGIRLSCLLNRDNPNSAADFFDFPLSKNKDKPGFESFYGRIVPYFFGDNENNHIASTEAELLTIKRIKSYFIHESAIGDSNNDGKFTGVTFPIFLLPLLEEDHNVLNWRISDLLIKDWLEEETQDGPNYLSLYGNMKQTAEFKLLFEYLFPINRILSLCTMYNISGLQNLSVEKISGGVSTVTSIYDPTKQLIADLAIPEETE